MVTCLISPKQMAPTKSSWQVPGKPKIPVIRDTLALPANYPDPTSDEVNHVADSPTVDNSNRSADDLNSNGTEDGGGKASGKGNSSLAHAQLQSFVRLPLQCAEPGCTAVADHQINSSLMSIST